MVRNVRTYSHACLTARTLELAGERWSLLVIRDLLTGPKRFTDLIDRLGGITPKTLSQRLRELGDAGIVVADREPGRREVWYSLTPAGADLRPVLDSLNWWGLRHAWRLPREGETLHPEHLLRSAIQAIEHVAGDPAPARWRFRVDGSDYLAESDGCHWHLAAPGSPGSADVTITATTGSLAALIVARADHDVGITGDPAQVQRFRRLIATMSAITGSAASAAPT